MPRHTSVSRHNPLQSQILSRSFDSSLPNSLTSIFFLDQRLLTLGTCCGFEYGQNWLAHPRAVKGSTVGVLRLGFQGHQTALAQTCVRGRSHAQPALHNTGRDKNSPRLFQALEKLLCVRHFRSPSVQRTRKRDRPHPPPVKRHRKRRRESFDGYPISSTASPRAAPPPRRAEARSLPQKGLTFWCENINSLPFRGFTLLLRAHLGPTDSQRIALLAKPLPTSAFKRGT